jgi:hypothetical protein
MSSRRARRLHRVSGDESPPPTTTGRGCRKRTVESRGFLTSRHGKVGQFQSLSHERVTALAFTLKVRSVTRRSDFQALLLHFEPGELTFELLNARLQAVGLRPMTARCSGGQRLVLNLGEIEVIRTFPSLPGLRGNLRRRARDLAASGLAPSRSPPARLRTPTLNGGSTVAAARGLARLQKARARR